MFLYQQEVLFFSCFMTLQCEFRRIFVRMFQFIEKLTARDLTLMFYTHRRVFEFFFQVPLNHTYICFQLLIYVKLQQKVRILFQITSCRVSESENVFNFSAWD